MIQVNVEGLAPALADAAQEALADLGIQVGEHGIPVEYHTCPQGMEVYFSNDGALVIRADALCRFFRGLSFIKQLVETGVPVKETQRFRILSYMPDVSRNAILTLDSARRMIRLLALMGYNDMMLYMEDVYELPGWPYFGYLRGRYTTQQLKDLVAYGKRFGLTLTPAVQSLAHLGSALHWNAFRPVRDTNDVLYVGKEETYEFLDQMLSHLCTVFETRTFNIGMDEAHTLGLGKRLREKGFVPKSQLMQEHLERVVELCRKHGVSPMIYSDMFFRIHGAPDYYSAEVVLPQEVVDSVSPDYTLIYWDYYNGADEESTRIVENMMAQHSRFAGPTCFMGGVSKWYGFMPHNLFSFRVGKTQLEACLRYGVDHVVVAGWADDGAEAGQFSVLPTLLYYAQTSYAPDREDLQMDRRFEDLFSACLSDFMLLDELNMVPELEGGVYRFNPCKYLLYNEPLGGKMDAHVQLSYDGHYAKLQEKLAAVAQKGGAYAYLFETAASLCGVLKTKGTVGLRLRQAYQKGDRAQLKELCSVLEQSARDSQLFHRAWKAQWQKENRLTGMEAVDVRLAGVTQRLISAKEAVEDYLAGKLPELESLSEPLLRADCKDMDDPTPKPLIRGEYSKIAASSNITVW